MREVSKVAITRKLHKKNHFGNEKLNIYEIKNYSKFDIAQLDFQKFCYVLPAMPKELESLRNWNRVRMVLNRKYKLFLNPKKVAMTTKERVFKHREKKRAENKSKKIVKIKVIRKKREISQTEIDLKYKKLKQRYREKNLKTSEKKKKEAEIKLKDTQLMLDQQKICWDYFDKKVSKRLEYIQEKSYFSLIEIVRKKKPKYISFLPRYIHLFGPFCQKTDRRFDCGRVFACDDFRCKKLEYCEFCEVEHMVCNGRVNHGSFISNMASNPLLLEEPPFLF